MKEKELRIALVCSGGISLSIYMHGISKEILKLVRASKSLHSIDDRTARSAASFFDGADAADPEYDTDAIYFELLQQLGTELELRVVVDVIAGASAGGINGTMLARALSHDLPMGALRDHWLDHADVDDLLAPEARAEAGSKWLLRPVLWMLGASGPWQAIREREARLKLSLFVRSRWFKEPLSGPRMTELMYNAVAAMGSPRSREASLLPPDQGLELFVTLTDQFGYQRRLSIHTPPVIYELEHRHVLKFRYERGRDGGILSDFDLENAPALAFAARATSSFPGAFPAAQVAEVDALVARKALAWPTRADFIARNFACYADQNIDPQSVCFIDGAVLNNRPFREAISAIGDHPAYREVDRRIVYVDPDPAAAWSAFRRRSPGFFSSLKSAMLDLPRTQPVTEELDWIRDHNEQVLRFREVVGNVRPSISARVAQMVARPLDDIVTVDDIRTAREEIATLAARDKGFAYEGYVALKLSDVRSSISRMIVALRGATAQSPFFPVVAAVVEAWALQAGATYEAYPPTGGPDASAEAPALPGWVRFLQAFDLDYQQRRLRFLVEGLNRLYRDFDRAQLVDIDHAAIDALKRGYYGCLSRLGRLRDISNFSAESRDLVDRLFAAVPAPGDPQSLERYARQFVEGRRDDIDRLIASLATDLDLTAVAGQIDALLAAAKFRRLPASAHTDFLVDYIGFPFWDVLTFPISTWSTLREVNEIKIDRISPQDAGTLAAFSGPQALKGVALGHFAAFLSRGYRENDYLLGRLHGLDRLIDIVLSAANIDAGRRRDVVLAIKQKGFRRILDAEEKHLANSAALVAALRGAVDALTAEGDGGGF
ncbi:MAG: patatin-like protein [Xanthobacteraceae bacterium]